MNNAKHKQGLLHGPLLKIKRAQHHINDLNQQIDVYLSTEPITFWISQSKSPPQRTVYTKAVPPIPEQFALIVGDAVNNMRSALDHICFAIADGASMAKSDQRKVGFPFAKNADDLHSAIHQRKLGNVSKDVLDAFISLRPYFDGDKYLSSIQDLSNRDKHHGIMTAVTGAEFSWLQLAEFIPVAAIPPHDPRTVVHTMGSFCQRLDPDGAIAEFDIKPDSQPRVLIGFGQGEFLQNEPFIPALRTMMVCAESAVKSLARAYFL